MAVDGKARRWIPAVIILLVAIQAGGFFMSMGPVTGGGAPRASSGGPLSAGVVSMPSLGQENTRKAPSPVKSLTLETFDAVAMDPNKHTLVEFYAPWCKPCQNLEPVFEELGRRFESDTNVVVAKVDATGEQALKKRFDITGYPRLKYFPAGGGVEAYSGDRDLESMVDFLSSKVASSPTVISSPTAMRRPPPAAVAPATPGLSLYEEYMAKRRMESSFQETARWIPRVVDPVHEAANPVHHAATPLRHQTESLFDSYMASRASNNWPSKLIAGSSPAAINDQHLSECTASMERPSREMNDECFASTPPSSAAGSRQASVASQRAAVPSGAASPYPYSCPASPSGLTPYEEYMRSRGMQVSMPRKIEAPREGITTVKIEVPRKEMASVKVDKPQTGRARRLLKSITSRPAGAARRLISRLLSPISRLLVGKNQSKSKTKRSSFHPECPDVSRANHLVASRERMTAAPSTTSLYDEYMASRARREAALRQRAPPQTFQQKSLSLYEEYMASRNYMR